ncbi:MAG: NAD-dependent epimerase/dehydratase family protein [Phycisphaerae bacterium]|nr:NAD-dependent epimerase/dehydratase family protein [Phycisphaerae bacterium]
MRRTVITGGAGFIGLNLCRRLLADARPGDEIVLVDNMERHGRDANLAELAAQPSVRVLDADLEDHDSLRRMPLPVDRVYHLAAVVGVGRVEADPERVLRTNTICTLNVLNWFAEHAGRDARVLFTSTSEVYAGGLMTDHPIPVPTAEDVPVVISDISNPRFSYAISKLWGEAYVRYVARATGRCLVSVRYHNVYGPRMGYEHVIPQIIVRIRAREKPFRVVGGDQTRAFCYVTDAVEATVRLMEAPGCPLGGVVHIGNSREEKRIAELYKELFALCGWKPETVEHVPAPKGSVGRRCPDTRLMETLTGFVPVVPLAEGLRKTTDWYMKADL